MAPTTPTNRHVGVAVNVITNAQYGFIQTWGVAAVNVAASTVASNRVVGLTSTAGQIGVEAEAAGYDTSYIGDVMVVATSAAQMGLVFLRID